MLVQSIPYTKEAMGRIFCPESKTAMDIVENIYLRYDK